MNAPIEIGTSPEPSLKHRVAKSAMWISIEMAGVQGISFAVFAAMAHYIVPRDFGLMSICFLAVQSLQVLILYNVVTIVVRKHNALDIDYTTAFWITIAFSVLCCLLLLLAAPAAEVLFHAPGLSNILRAMSAIVLFMGLQRTHEAWLIRHFQLRPMAIRSLVGAIVGGVFGLILAVKGFGVGALVGQQIVTGITSTALTWIVCPWRPNFAFSASTAAEILRFMLGIAPNSFVYAVNQNCDTFLVALFFGPFGAGLYNVGKRIRLALQLAAGGPIKSIALPSLAEIQNDPDRLRRGALNSIQILCIICCPAFFGASAVAHDAVIVIFGRNWANAAPIMETLSVGGLAIVLMNYNDNVFLLKNKPSWCLLVSLSYSIIAILLVAAFVFLKIKLIALPFVLPYLVVFPFSAILVSKCLNISLRQWVDALLPGLGSALVMFVVIHICEHYLSGTKELLRLIISIAIGSFTYLLVLSTVWRHTIKMVIKGFSRSPKN
jgi:PST family polysaccharide transporter